MVLLILLVAALNCSPGGSRVVRRSAAHMGTVVTISVVATSKSHGEQSIDRGFAEIARLEQMLSSYRATSVLSRLNAMAGAGPVSVPEEFIELILVAQEVAASTGSAFNPLMGPAVKLWGIPENPRVPSPEALEALRPLTDLAGLSVMPQRGTVALSRPGMALGLGGIAKGYTADRVTEILKGLGVTGGVVAISGDVRVFGTQPDGSPWRVAVQDPGGGPDPIAVIEMSGGALSTSGDYQRFFEQDGIRYHHILDPRTLRPTRGLASVSVLTADGVRADALATAVLVMGAVEGLAYVEASAGVEALFVDQNGHLTATSGWPKRP